MRSSDGSERERSVGGGFDGGDEVSDVKTSHGMCDEVDAGTFREGMAEEFVHLFGAFFDGAGTVVSGRGRSKQKSGRRERWIEKK